MAKPTFAQLKRRLLDEGANIDEMLASKGDGPADEGKPPAEEAAPPMPEGGPSEEASEPPAAEAAEPPGADMAEGEPPAEPPMEEGPTVSPALVAKLKEYGPPDTWSPQTLMDLDPGERKELKDAWSKLSPDEQDDIRSKAKGLRRGDKATKAGDIAFNFGRK